MRILVANRLSSKQCVVVGPRRFSHQLRNAVDKLFDFLIHFELQRHLHTNRILKYLQYNTCRFLLNNQWISYINVIH